MKPFQFGIDTLLNRHTDWLRGRRVGLVAHPASVDAQGVPTPERLHAHPAINLTCIFGPEHGFLGAAAAGDTVGHARHPGWGIPVYSLYGETRKPTPDMLNQTDVILFDLQNLAVRCYTYASTLRLLLEAAAESGKTVIVADRPVPAPSLLDGPMLDPAFESFVALLDAPFCYGMTTAETARFLAAAHGLDLELLVAPLEGFDRARSPWPLLPWRPPSPGIRAYATALTYPVAVCCEALPALHYARGRPDIFQTIAASWMNGPHIASRLNALGLPGISFEPAAWRTPDGNDLSGFTLRVTDEASMRPFLVMLHILTLLQQEYGIETLWNAPGTRPDFFDKLMGTDRVRLDLLSGRPAETIAATLAQPSARFLRQRENALLYGNLKFV